MTKPTKSGHACKVMELALGKDENATNESERDCWMCRCSDARMESGADEPRVRWFAEPWTFTAFKLTTGKEKFWSTPAVTDTSLPPQLSGILTAK